MNNPLKIAGIVILFNPNDAIKTNISSYIDFLDKLFIIDNSIISKRLHIIDLIGNKEKIEYISMGKNIGVATALNIGSSMAVDLGFDWLMLMDQDSRASFGMMDSLLQSIYKFPECGILAPIQITKNKDYIKYDQEYTDILVTMTSGSLLNLKVYRKCGPFEDKLFIDHVDHEYCLRLKTRGYKVVQCNRAMLRHFLGEVRDINIFGWKITITTHEPFRLYFFTRNGLFVSFKYLFDYPSFMLYFSIQLSKNIFKAIFLEGNKLERLKMIYTGTVDFLMKRYGKRLSLSHLAQQCHSKIEGRN